MFAAILAFGLFGHPKAQPCPPQALAQCVDTRALTADPEFLAALRAFLGPAHERLLHGDRPLYDQVLELLAKPDPNAPQVGEDMRLYAGCRRMACPEKAAVIVGRRGIEAIGVIDYTKGDPDLEVIVRHSGASAWGPQQVLRHWAEVAVTHQAEHDHAGMTLRQTRLRALEEETAGGPTPERRRLFNLPHL
jgi:hypothetical protein